MLATRHRDTEHDPWSFTKYASSPQNIPDQRMSNSYVASLSTQPEWQGHIDYPQQHVGVNLPYHFDRIHDSPDLRYTRPPIEETRAMDIQVKAEEGSPVHPRSAELRMATGPMKDTSGASNGLEDHDKGLSSLVGSSRVEEPAESWLEQCGRQAPEENDLEIKDEDDDCIEVEDGAEQEKIAPPLTAAERSAAKRKMKRFRLTHQQTRFLMTEFVKQPHPDAAHREKLSREIPGLSPRQVQVWFQNRRAKIKRLDAEDRDRVIKMRAVPEDFDNIQALHSPYGAMYGLGQSLASPTEMGNQPFRGHSNRSLVVDVQRPEADSNLSPTTLTPVFEGVGFTSSAASSSEITSPLSTTSSDRYTTYSSHLSSFGGGRRGSTAYSRGQGRFDSTLQAGQSMHPLQPLNLRETLSRQRAGSMQTPLRTGLSWKSETIEYPGYQQGSNSSSTMTDRPQSIYPMGTSSNVDSGSYETENYSGHSAQSSTRQDYSPGRSRLRASTATFPLNLDVRNQYRPLGHTSRSPEQSVPNRSATSPGQYTSPSIYTTSYPPAPLTAPTNTPQSRGATNSRGDVSDHSQQNLSGPTSSAGDFPRSVHGDVAMNPSIHTQTRDSFGGGTTSFVQNHERQGTYNNEDLDGPGIPQRKLSYTGHGGVIGERTSPGTHIFNHGT